MVEETLPTTTEALVEPTTEKRKGRPLGRKDSKPRRLTAKNLSTTKKNLPTKYIHSPIKSWDPNFLTVVQNLVSAGCTEGEVGAIIGYAAKNLDKAVQQVRASHPEFNQAWKNGQRLANCQLVAGMYKVATGYFFDEVSESYKIDEETGKPVLTTKKITRCYQRPDPSVLMFLVANRLKEEFKNVQRVEVDKRSTNLTAIADLTTKQMGDLTGKLVEHLTNQRKKIDSISRNVIPGNTQQNSNDTGRLPDIDSTGDISQPGIPEDTSRVSSPGLGGQESVPGNVQG